MLQWEPPEDEVNDSVELKLGGGERVITKKQIEEVYAALQALKKTRREVDGMPVGVLGFTSNGRGV